MSPNAANSLVHDLVEMAKSHEALPLVQHELSDARVTIDAQQSTIQRLELKLLDRAGEIDEVRASLRKAEEDRDEATRAFLEADDRTEKVLAFLRSTMGNAQALLDAVDGPTVTPQPQQAVVEDVGQSESPLASTVTVPVASSGPVETAIPTSIVGQGSESIVTDSGPAISSHSFEPMGTTFHGDATNIDSVSTAPAADASVGQSEADPTHATIPTEDMPSSVTSTVMTKADAAGPDDVGYHNEPEGATGWMDWYDRMNRRYPDGWPERHPRIYG